MPNEDQIKILIDPTVLAQVDAACPSYLSRTAFINQAVDLYLNGVDSGITLIKPSAREARVAVAEGFISNKEDIDIKTEKKKKPPKDPFALKRLDPELIPAELQDCSDQIIEFWAVKKGTRSEGAATRLFNKLEAMTPADRIKALNIATDSGWASVFPPRDQPRTQSAGNIRDTPTETAHPAGKVFTASDVIGGAFN